MTDKELMEQAVTLAVDIKIIDALQDLGKRTLDNDKALLAVTEALAEKIIQLTKEVDELRTKLELLHMSMHRTGQVN